MTPDDLKDRCRINDEGCWLWAGAKSKGVPRIWAPDHTKHGGEKHTQTGRRAMWHVNTGKPIPNGWRVFGTCEEATCINPDHMVCRPVAEQGAKVAKSGKLRGNVRKIAASRATGRKRSHLTPDLISIIRTSPKSGLQLEREMGIDHRTISKVRTGKATAFAPVGGIFSGLLR